jgi:hypothetical protein
VSSFAAAKLFGYFSQRVCKISQHWENLPRPYKALPARYNAFSEELEVGPRHCVASARAASKLSS